MVITFKVVLEGYPTGFTVKIETLCSKSCADILISAKIIQTLDIEPRL